MLEHIRAAVWHVEAAISADNKFDFDLHFGEANNQLSLTSSQVFTIQQDTDIHAAVSRWYNEQDNPEMYKMGQPTAHTGE